MKEDAHEPGRSSLVLSPSAECLPHIFFYVVAPFCADLPLAPLHRSQKGYGRTDISQQHVFVWAVSSTYWDTDESISLGTLSVVQSVC
jgi:hypothetical protein